MYKRFNLSYWDLGPHQRRRDRRPRLRKHVHDSPREILQWLRQERLRRRLSDRYLHPATQEGRSAAHRFRVVQPGQPDTHS